MILNKKNPESIEEAAALIRDGSVCVLPCDTIYGLCAAYKIGEKALKTLKGRDENKPFLVLATIEQAKQLCTEIPGEILDIWPAPLTAILNTREGNTLAIRVPKDEYLQSILREAACPIYSTSVNMSGEPSLLNFTDIYNRFEADVDFLVKGSEVQGTVPSTLIDATVRPFKVLRQGQFDATELVKRSGLN